MVNISLRLWQKIGGKEYVYAEESVPFTRIHEPRHLHPERSSAYPKDKTLIIKEYSLTDNGMDTYYPINDQKNLDLVLQYRDEAAKHQNLNIAGRLGDYKYYDMHQTIGKVFYFFDEIIDRKNGNKGKRTFN